MTETFEKAKKLMPSLAFEIKNGHVEILLHDKKIFSVSGTNDIDTTLRVFVHGMINGYVEGFNNVNNTI
jgi:hypothetical protein